MKRIIYIATLLFLFTACNNDAPEQSGKPLDQSQDMIQQFKPVINGVWVKKNYIKKLLKEKSPLEAADRATGITVFAIDTEKLKADSITVPVGYGNHEGGEVSLKFHPGRNTTTIMMGNDELSYTIKNGDTTLIIYHYDQSKRETTTDKYIKAFSKQPTDDIGFALSYMINKGMLAGTYKATDAAGKSYNITLTNDGKISGYPGLNTYFVQNDLGGPMNNLDAIIFNLNTDKQQEYAFEMKKRNLTLRQTKANADSTLLIPDKVFMTLVKDRK